MKIAVEIIAILSGLALIVSEVLQTPKSDGFSVVTGTDTGHFQQGAQEHLLETISRYSAIVWIVACVVFAYMWYHSPR